MDVRVSLIDFRMAYRAVDEAHRAGRGALERTAVTFGVRRAVVMAAVDRVETALGGGSFFEVRVRRSGVLTATGDAFRLKAPNLIRAWEAMLPHGPNPTARGMSFHDEPEHGFDRVVPPSAIVADLLAAVRHQGRRIDEVMAAIEASRTPALRDGTAPAGTKAADAMKVVLAILKRAGADGIDSLELRAALRSADIKSGTSETAKAILRAAGLVRFEDHRWYVD